MTKEKLEYRKVSDLIPYVNNPRNNEMAVDAVASSIKNFGFKNPIVIDNKNEIINGHTRLKAAKKLDMEEVPVIVANDLTPEQIKAFRLADNKVAELAEWDEDLLLSELAGIEMDMRDFGFYAEPEEEAEEEDIYTMKVDVPQYQITGACPELEMLYDSAKYNELLDEIEKAELPEDVREFLKLSATRHIKFNYGNIAEFYAHADKNVQELFEKSALVIIDFNDAIKNGYVKLSEKILNMRMEQ